MSGKECPAAVHDAALDKIATSTRMTVCSDPGGGGFPNVSTVATYKLAQVTGMTSGDFTKADDGGTHQRKVTVGAKSAVSVTVSGTAANVVLDDTTNVLYVTTCSSQALTSGGTVDIPAWAVHYTDPT